MIKSLDILGYESGSAGVVNDSAAWSEYMCVVGLFSSISGFASPNIALVNTTTGEIDSTSDLALALKSLGKNEFSEGFRRVIYETSDGHPCLIFLSNRWMSNRCYVFFLETLTGQDLLLSTPVAFSSPFLEEYNLSLYKDIKVCSSQRALIVYGSFYIGNPSISLDPHNGCLAVALDDIWSNLGTANSAVYANFGQAPVVYDFYTQYGGIAIDDANSVLYIYNHVTRSVESYAISTTALTFMESVAAELGGAPTSNRVSTSMSTTAGMMEFYDDKLYIGLYTNNTIPIIVYNTASEVWDTDYFEMYRGQAFGHTFPSGMRAVDGKLYIWGGFTQVYYPEIQSASLSYLGLAGSHKTLAFNKRSGLAVFDISSTPSIIGEDLQLSLGKPSLSYYPPPYFNPYEQTAACTHMTIDSGNVYMFMNIRELAYGVTGLVSNPVGTVAYKRAVWKRGVEYNANPIKITLDGRDTQLFEPNMLY